MCTICSCLSLYFMRNIGSAFHSNVAHWITRYDNLHMFPELQVRLGITFESEKTSLFNSFLGCQHLGSWRSPGSYLQDSVQREAVERQWCEAGDCVNLLNSYSTMSVITLRSEVQNFTQTYINKNSLNIDVHDLFMFVVVEIQKNKI